MVSIVLCTYNRAYILKETIDSILEQTYSDFELIIVDDGSTDNTQNLLSEYTDSRVRSFVLEENSYYCAAANFGIKQAQGDYVAFATSDDTWEPEKLEKQIDYLDKRKECGACFTFAKVIDEKGEDATEKYPNISEPFHKNLHTRRAWIQRLIFRGNCICHPSAVIRREVLNAVGGYNLYYSRLADMDLWLRILRYFPIHMIEKELVNYRCFKNAEEQISGVTEKGIVKTVNESMLIRRSFVNSLSDEEMLKFFEDCFYYKEAYSHQELEIEKAFLLKECVKEVPELWILGMEKFEELLRDEEKVQILKERYHIKVQDIYRWNEKSFYKDCVVIHHMGIQEQVIAKQQEQLKEYEDRNRQLLERQIVLEKMLYETNESNESLEGRIYQLTKNIEELEENQQNEKLELQIKDKMLREIKEENEQVKKSLNQALLEKLSLQENAGKRGRK